MISSALKIGFARRRRAEPHALVGHLHVRRARVGVGIDRDRLDPHAPRGADHPARNLPAIGDQDFLEHQPAALWPQQKVAGNERQPNATSAILRRRPGPLLRHNQVRSNHRAKHRSAIASIANQRITIASASTDERTLALIFTPPPHRAAGGCGRAGAAPRRRRRRGWCRGRRSPARPRRGARHNPAAG